jgi:glycosyltransferase involved in cell wall biosynthesis
VIGGVAVVVPARDEQARLGRCLASIQRATDVLPRDLRVVIVVAADSCADGTEAVAAAHATFDPRISVVSGTWGRAGAARRAGTAAALARLPTATVVALWLVSTDADSVVPPTWLHTHVTLAAAGWEAVAGVVRLGADASPVLRARFRGTYHLPRDRPHRHVHGANLGVRADAYTAVGGWAAHLAVGEDQHLWDALRVVDHRVLATSDLWVTTSDRLQGRAPDGFAARLEELLS